MIRYHLSCEHGHGFDSWFRSGADFDALRAAGRLTCPDCGSPKVDKALMTPEVQPSRNRGDERRPLSGPPRTERERALAELRRRIEEDTEYVGMRFAAEARAIHAGEAPERPIWGEARSDEARRLIEEGVPVAPLPFLPRPKVN
jgi:hypothetical protein